MKIRDFTYDKSKNELKKYNLLVLNETETHISGVSLGYLTEDERAQLVKLQEDYEKSLDPFLKKGFRQFLKNKIVG